VESAYGAQGNGARRRQEQLQVGADGGRHLRLPKRKPVVLRRRSIRWRPSRIRWRTACKFGRMGEEKGAADGHGRDAEVA
jgi:hypothetical protein